MKTITIKKISLKDINAEKVPALMDEKKIQFHAIDQINWESYPYCPKALFRIAYTQEAILINYRIEEKSVRAKYEKDNDAVWTDSCAEFFVIPANDGIYYNIESNCIGTVLGGVGKERHNRERAPQDVLDKIQRWASLGNKSFDERIEDSTWELSLIIPYSVFYKHQLKSFDSKTINANFYKCGDELQTPHFISWNRIEAPKPDFHRPESFGELVFCQ